MSNAVQDRFVFFIAYCSADSHVEHAFFFNFSIFALETNERSKYDRRNFLPIFFVVGFVVVGTEHPPLLHADEWIERHR